jgi:hypothetical protein
MNEDNMKMKSMLAVAAPRLMTTTTIMVGGGTTAWG